MTIMLVTDCRRASPDARTEQALVAQSRRWLAEAIEAGVDIIQVREPHLTSSALVALTRGLVSDARGASTSIVVNDRVDVAIAAGAHGAHLRDDGWPTGRVRTLLGADRILGRSVHDVETARTAVGVDYLVFGAVFASGDKPARGVEALRAVTSASTVPVLAIGGIGPARAGACRTAGAAGIAAISVFLPVGRAPDACGPREAVARLRYSYETIS